MRLGLFAILVLLISGCEYTEPFTNQPTAKVDVRLLGTWQLPGESERVWVRQLDDDHYVIAMQTAKSLEVHRAYVAALGKQNFLITQALEPENRRYQFFQFAVSADGKEVKLRRLNEKIIPDSLKESAKLKAAITANLTNPQLFVADASVFRKIPE